MSPIERKVEVVRGEIDAVTEKDLRRLWAHTVGIDGDDATERLTQVVCVLRNPDGGLAGVNSVLEEEVDHAGGRRFLVYRSLLPGPAAASWDLMFNTAFDFFAQDFKPTEPGPVGLFAAIHEPGLLERRDAIWPGSGLIYAGYLPDGRQARLRYFEYALI